MGKKLKKGLALTIIALMMMIQYVCAYSVEESGKVTYDNGTMNYGLDVSDDSMKAYTEYNLSATRYVTCITYQFKTSDPTIVIGKTDSNSSNTEMPAHVERNANTGYQFYLATSTHKVSNSSGYIQKELPQ